MPSPSSLLAAPLQSVGLIALDPGAVRLETEIMNYIGLMSGTSMDAIDAVVASISTDKKVVLRATHHEPYPANVKKRLLALRDGAENDIELAAGLDSELGELFAQAAQRVQRKAGLAAHEIRAIGSHGQTIRHRPDAAHPFSLQIGSPSVIAEHTGITTVGDFRSRDIAAGGQGAPLAPGFHGWAFHSPDYRRAIVNIGGIANVTYLPADKREPIRGFDTGPGNTLLDAWITRHQDEPYDHAGQWASTGRCLTELLQRLCSDRFFRISPPKSTGFEYFSLKWLQHYLAEIGVAPRAEDVQATLVELTARSITQALTDYLPQVDELYVCGGGSHNNHLMAALRANVGIIPLNTTAALGIDPDWVEAVAFAWLAHQTLEGCAGNVPTVTGARHAVILGGVYKVR
jgi:anhydro-N-acetylmuramic acid kinase